MGFATFVLSYVFAVRLAAFSSAIVYIRAVAPIQSSHQCFDLPLCLSAVC